MRLGCDIVDLPRLNLILQQWETALQARLLTAAEQAWCSWGDLPVLVKVAACLAVKESLIKALGGRQTGFKWTDLELLLPGCPVPVCLVNLVQELVSQVGLAAEKLHTQPCRAYGQRGWAVWGWKEQMVIAAVLLDYQAFSGQNHPEPVQWSGGNYNRNDLLTM
ncbi:MAG: 4'-phosphopantetheinyl transferase superfamily protein [Desulfurispora sp.]|uniref:4'-phosphopantetheinyl transferase superfamily protein n=1 Tax=Desulfurispora sp. TaxID=3014275 RepID=UPI0040498ED1